jgi:hypothetical protein
MVKNCRCGKKMAIGSCKFAIVFASKNKAFLQKREVKIDYGKMR